MPNDQWKRVVDLFETASALPEAERDPWVRAQCAGNDSLYAEVRSLLDAARAESDATLASPPSSVALLRYGSWQADRVIGSGGMGSVLLVHRADGEFEQTAALKLVAPHLAGPYFLERFRIERQILAQLNHPNITKLLDGGVAEDSGVPYLVMEYVDGLPLDTYADERKLSIRDRLQLFLKICDAVAFAHRNLIVHRDLKPSNILVESATGEPKLLDFGTARLLPQDGATDTTTTLHRLVTPRYASPEALRHAPITTQADVFSLGVLLYEQITGAWPFGDISTPVEVAQRITSGIPMAPPDSRITQKVAEARSTNLRELKGVLRGDLAKILQKATQTELSARYKSVEEFAEDLRAFLDGRPVSAQTPTPWYRARKFLRRHWLPAGAAAMLAIGLAGASIYSYKKAEEARREADRSFVATMALRRLIESASAASAGPDIKLSGWGTRSESDIADADPSIRPYLRSSFAFVAMMAGDYETGAKQARIAAELARSTGDPLAEAGALTLLARVIAASNTSDAMLAARRALALSYTGGESRYARAMRVQADGIIGYLGLLGAPGANDTEARFVEAIRLGNQDPLLKFELVTYYALFAQFHVRKKNREGELAALNSGLALFRAQASPNLVDALILDQYRGRLDRDGDFAGAERLARERYELALRIAGQGHFQTLDPRMVWANQLGRTGDLNSASDHLAACRQLAATLPPEARIQTAWKLPFYSAIVENRRGNAAAAEQFARQARQAGLDVKWNDQSDTRMADAHLELGIALRQSKRFDEARQELSLSQKVYQAVWGTGDRRTRLAASELARAEARDAALPPNP